MLKNGVVLKFSIDTITFSTLEQVMDLLFESAKLNFDVPLFDILFQAPSLAIYFSAYCSVKLLIFCKDIVMLIRY
jgi:hypothetical protein